MHALGTPGLLLDEDNFSRMVMNWPLEPKPSASISEGDEPSFDKVFATRVIHRKVMFDCLNVFG